MRTRMRYRRQGFTLVELLTVIGIISVLVGLLTSAVFFARQTMLRGAMAFEVETLGNAMDQYKNKFGDFPPDGSNASVLRSHLNKAFPQIAASEIALLTTDTFPTGQIPGNLQIVNFANGSPAGVMDPTEALVFFLGGFSDDSSYPFSGPGGPFFITNSAGVQVNSSVAPASRGSVQYNVDRTNSFFDFKQGQLTLQVHSSGTTVSQDETDYFTGGVNDCLPSFKPSSKDAPYVYFDSRTYSYLTSGGRFFNFYNPDTIGGVARPYKGDEINTTVAASVNAEGHYRYVNDKSFQIICAGLDDDFGGVPGVPNAGTPQFFRFPSGDSLNIVTEVIGETVRYAETAGTPSPQLDNVTNFSDGAFEDSLEN